MRILKKQLLWRGVLVACSVVMMVMLMLASLLEENKALIDGFLGTTSTVIKSGEDDADSLYQAFVPPDTYLTDGKADTEKMIQNHRDLSRELCSEGSVLLKNNGGLPLAKGSKVTLFGLRSYIMTTGAGSGYNVNNNATYEIQLRTALADPRGANYSLNPTMIEAYKLYNDALPSGQKAVSSSGNNPPSMGDTAIPYDPYEPSLAQLAALSPNYQSSFSGFSDAAIVVVARPSAESRDFWPGQDGVAAGLGARNALALTTNEKDMIDLACANFNKVIVLVNTNSAMEIQYLEDKSQVKSVLWIGHPGTYGALGVADVLCGNANPSGALSDVYASHSMSSPAMMNMGHFKYANANLITRERVLGMTGTDAGFENYLIEAEGIYTGYRYYETRYFDSVYNQGNAKSSAGMYDSKGTAWNYADEVTYGFGYGLSYSTFTQTIGAPTIKQGPHEFTATFPVTVKNTGSVAGKSIVQLYAQVPYTDYDKTNKVEKAAIQLVAFGKTPILEPGVSETMTIAVDFQDLASYDYKNAKTYILDAGNYYFAIGNGAHDALNNILAKQSKTTANGMDYSGDASKVQVYNYNYPNGVDSNRFSISKSNAGVTNQLKYSDWNDYEPGKVTHLSRENWQTSWPKTYSDMVIPTNMVDHLNGKYIEIKTSDEANIAKLTFGAEGTEKFGNMKFSTFDDSRWEEVINQMSLDETINFAFRGGRQFADVESINFIGGTWADNGTCGVGGATKSWYGAGREEPWSIQSSDPNRSYNCRVFCSAPVIASTFNDELSHKMGVQYGNDALFFQLSIFWGPGLNTHRHPYNGRNGEYFSEDPVLSAYIGKAVVLGGLERGLICAPKHFAFNDQEMHRMGVAPFMTEQRAREIELRAFQIPFEGGMLGCMTSFSKIGGIECNASIGLLTEILRNEWGYDGYVVSDMNDDFDLAPQAYIAGMTAYDTSQADSAILPYKNLLRTDAKVLEAVKDAAKRNMYVLSQSNLMNRITATSYAEWNMTWWRMLYITGLGVSGGLSAISAALYITSILLTNKKKGAV